jgi:hypothetical protein
VAVYALTGTATSENWMNPFQTVRDAIARTFRAGALSVPARVLTLRGSR